MPQVNLKDKAKAIFNSRAAIAIRSGAKGGSISIQLLSFALKVGVVAAVAPFAVTAAVGGGALIAGGIVAYDQFRKAAKRAEEKENNAALALRLNQPRIYGYSFSL